MEGGPPARGWMIVDATGYDCPVAKKEILPIPVSRANRAARRSSARTVARLMDEAREPWHPDEVTTRTVVDSNVGNSGLLSASAAGSTFSPG